MPRSGAIVLAAALLLRLPLPATAGWATNGRAEVALAGDGSTWQVQANLDDRVTGHFLVDTGASLCVVSPDVASRLRVTPQGHATLRTANGTVRAPIVVLRRMAVGTKVAENVRAVVHPSVGDHIDGIVGLNFLNQFQYAIDPKRKVLRLE